MTRSPRNMLIGMALALAVGFMVHAVVVLLSLAWAAKTNNTFTRLHLDGPFQAFGLEYEWENRANDVVATTLRLGWPLYSFEATGEFGPDPASPPGTIQLRPSWAYPSAAYSLLPRGRLLITAAAIDSIVFGAPMLGMALMLMLLRQPVVLGSEPVNDRMDRQRPL